MNKTAGAQQTKTSSVLPTTQGMLQRKCACGNQTLGGGECPECKKKKNSLQRKLTIGASNDPLEQEADRVADQVMSMPINTKVNPAPPRIQRFSGQSSDSLDSAPPSVDRVLASPGRPMEPELRQDMEARFGHDFSQVRVHTGSAAEQSAQDINAKAYTVGLDVVFGAGQYLPQTTFGKQLLAHELVHVAQQSETAKGIMMSRNRGIIRRYGHSRSCKNDEHLKPFIWPGHGHAKLTVQRASEETDGRSLSKDIAQHVTTFFGKKSTEPGNLAKIHANFTKIQQALDQNYLYHCSKKGDSSDGLSCKGQNAETERSGNKDITLCFDRLQGWATPAAGWLIAHENVHRGLDIWGHSWEAGNIGKCINHGGALSAAELDLDNADSYACFAAIVGAPKPEDKPELVK